MKDLLKVETLLYFFHDVPGLYEAFGTKKFDALYKKYEKDTTIPKKTIQARTLIGDVLKERAETGRIYIMNIDSIQMSIVHLLIKCVCSIYVQEITLPTDPLQHIDGKGEIALCILSAINVGVIKDLKELNIYVI